MAASVKEKGVLTPLLVCRAGEGYQLIAGERRWRAAQRAGLERVPVVVRDATPAESLELALVENLHRQDLNPIEEALAYQRLLEQTGVTQEELARRLGKDRSTVTNQLRLLGLPLDIQQDLMEGRLSMGCAILWSRKGSRCGNWKSASRPVQAEGRGLGPPPGPTRTSAAWRMISRGALELKWRSPVRARGAGSSFISFPTRNWTACWIFSLEPRTAPGDFFPMKEAFEVVAMPEEDQGGRDQGRAHQGRALCR